MRLLCKDSFDIPDAEQACLDAILEATTALTVERDGLRESFNKAHASYEAAHDVIVSLKAQCEVMRKLLEDIKHHDHCEKGLCECPEKIDLALSTTPTKSDELAELRRDNEAYIETFGHYFVANKEEDCSYTCAKCHLQLSDPIHTRNLL